MRLNVGSGQRRFDPKAGWINVDCQARLDQMPDIVASGEALPFAPASMEMVVLHHVLEHFGCGEGARLLQECHSSLVSQGSLLVFVPDMRALASRWLASLVGDFIFFANCYGAYQGSEFDRHKWGFTKESLVTTLRDGLEWTDVRPFDWRPIPGASIARDWWILGMEAVK